MAPQINRNLERWVERLAKDLTPEGTISRIELLHVIEEAGGGERLTVIVMEDRPSDEDPGCIAQELWEEAYQHSETQPEGSVQRYVARAYRGESQTAEESKSFLINGSAVTSLVGGMTESPSVRGLTAQDMRHNETLHAMVIRLCEASSVSLARQVTSERTENDRLRARIRADEEKRLEWQREKASDDRFDQMLGLVMQLAPMVVAKLTSGRGGPPSGGAEPPTEPPAASGHAPEASAGAAAAPIDGDTRPIGRAAIGGNPARDVAVGHVLSTLTKEQIETILGCLNQNQAVALMEIYSSFQQEASTPSAPRRRNGVSPASKENVHHGDN